MRYAARAVIPLWFHILSIATAMAVLSCNDMIAYVFVEVVASIVISSVTFTRNSGQHGFNMAACVDTPLLDDATLFHPGR